MTAENDHMRAAAEEKNALLLDLEVVKNTERGEHRVHAGYCGAAGALGNMADLFNTKRRLWFQSQHGFLFYLRLLSHRLQ